MKIRFSIAVVLLCLLGVGCAKPTQLVPMPDQSVRVEDPEKARIYVIRPSNFGGAISMEVRDNDRTIGFTGPSSYLSWEREPGDVQVIGIAEDTSVQRISAVKGMVYFVLQRLQMGVIKARNELELIGEDEARQYLEKCNPAKVK